ncbi:hypothetical protein AAC387_Pa03g0555 [Persea americana]
MAKEPHVLMFPWLAFGHMLPFLELSKSLAKMGLTITFISTPRNIQRLPPIPPSLTSHLHLLQIPLPAIDSLPENSEATIDVPEQMAQYLKKAYDGLQASFETIVGQILPDLIVFDFVPCWVPAIAAKFNVRSAFFSVFSAATLAFVGSPTELRHARKRTKPEDFIVAPDWIPFPSTLAHRCDQAVRIFHNLNVPDESKLSSGQRLATSIEGCDFVLVRSCREFEWKYLDLITELYQKPVLPVGLLPPAPAGQATGRSLGASMWSSTFQWLDTRPQKSVVFVGFGSEFKMTKEQVHELGFGLDLSGLPFVWVLGRLAGSIDDSDLLPPGFETHIADRGIVSVGWVPQLEILGHPAIGGFLFHSGWGSIIEALQSGHPLIVMPMIADQRLNARLLVDEGVCFEVERKEDGSFTREAVAISLRHVMVDAEGEPLRNKAREMKTIFANQALHESYIHGFLHYLNNIKRS